MSSVSEQLAALKRRIEEQAAATKAPFPLAPLVHLILKVPENCRELYIGNNLQILCDWLAPIEIPEYAESDLPKYTRLHHSFMATQLATALCPLDRYVDSCVGSMRVTNWLAKQERLKKIIILESLAVQGFLISKVNTNE